MTTLASDTIRKMEQLPQAQYSLEEQILELQRAANKLGLYDAADFIGGRVRAMG